MSRQSVTATGQEKRVFVSVTVVWDDDAEPEDIEAAIDAAADQAEGKARGLW